MLGKKERRIALLGVGGEALLQEAHRREAIDERVVDLRKERKAAAFESLDEVRLPRRIVEVDRRAVEARHEDAELTLIARRG